MASGSIKLQENLSHWHKRVWFSWKNPMEWQPTKVFYVSCIEFLLHSYFFLWILNKYYVFIMTLSWILKKIYFWKHQTINHLNLNSWKIKLVENEHFFTNQIIDFWRVNQVVIAKGFWFLKEHDWCIVILFLDSFILEFSKIIMFFSLKFLLSYFFFIDKELKCQVYCLELLRTSTTRMTSILKIFM